MLYSPLIIHPGFGPIRYAILCSTTEFTNDKDNTPALVRQQDNQTVK